ncbi:MAG: radical SAM protein, partial [Acidobacteriota bacterium]
LADLLSAILEAELRMRIRLNSLEPRTVDDRVLSLLAQAPDVLVPHIQIPLQSGCDAVLARMSRNYRTTHYRDVIERAKAMVPQICLGADVITGFPGETAAEHAQSEQFIASLPLDYLHVFTYSARPGTRAASLSAQPHGEIVRPRTAALLQLGRAAAQRFRRSQLGRVQSALVLAGRTASGQARTLTGNYIEVLLPQAEPGRILDVRLTKLEDDGQTVLGEVAA